MVWLFGKKDKKKAEEEGHIPKLPELPPMPEEKNPLDSPRIKDELPPLPSYPPTPAGEKISHEILKDAVKKPEIIPAPPSKIPELPEFIPQKFPSPPPKLQKTEKPMAREIRQVIKTGKSEPLFVRIDKYEDAMESFNEIKRKVLEIEGFLKDIKEIKDREESELSHWEQELQSVKTKLERIDRAVFKKLD